MTGGARIRYAEPRRKLNAPSKLARSLFGAGLIGLLLRAWTSFAKQNLFDPEPVLLILATG
jgi:hypothetical protein